MIFIMGPLIYFNSKDIEENLYVTEGEIVSSEFGYRRTGSSNRDNVGILMIKFYNEVQKKEMTREALLSDHEELPEFPVGKTISIGYTEGRDFMSGSDAGLFLMDRYRSHDGTEIIKIISIAGASMFLLGFLLRLLYFKFKKD